MAEQEFERFVIMSQSILENKDLNTTEKLLLARYSGFKGGIIFESPDMTSKNIGVCLRTLKRARTHLEELGYIKCVEDHGRGKKYMVCNSCTSGVQKLHTENKKEKEISKDISYQPSAGDIKVKKSVSLDVNVSNLVSIIGVSAPRSATEIKRANKDYGIARHSYSDEELVLAAKAMSGADQQYRTLKSLFYNTAFWLGKAKSSNGDITW